MTTHSLIVARGRRVHPGGRCSRSAIKIVREYQRLVVFRLGGCSATKGPGLVILIPLIDKAVTVDLREFYLEIPHQSAITEDNASISIDFIVFNKVIDPQMSVLTVGNFAGAAQNIAATTLRSVVGDMSLDDVLAKREQMNEILRIEARRGDRALGREGHERRDPRDHPAARRAGGDDAADVRRAHAARRRHRGRGRQAGRDHGGRGQQGGRDPERRGSEAGGDPERRGRPAGRHPAGRGLLARARTRSTRSPTGRRRTR